jgi:S1-C subfamily serine protease
MLTGGTHSQGKADNLEQLKTLGNFEMFRLALEAAVPRSDRTKGGRPPFDHVLMFKVLVLQAPRSAEVNFQKGDVILAVNGVKVRTTRDLLRAASGGHSYWKLTIERGGEVVTTVLGG